MTDLMRICMTILCMSTIIEILFFIALAITESKGIEKGKLITMITVSIIIFGVIVITSLFSLPMILIWEL